MSYSTRNGVKSYYEVCGEGFPLVLMHANPFDRRLFLYRTIRAPVMLAVWKIRRPSMSMF